MGGYTGSDYRRCFGVQNFHLDALKRRQRPALIGGIGAEGEGGVYRDLGLRQGGLSQYGVAQHTDMGHETGQHDASIALGGQVLGQGQAAEGFLFPNAILPPQRLGGFAI